MKSAVLKNNKIEIIETAIPDLLNRKGAIVKVDGCGLCGSDIVKINNCLSNKNLPVPVLGHEVVGEIVEINADSDFKKGDTIALGHHYPCFKCKYCIHKSYSMCETFKTSNIEPCGFSEYIYINPNHLKNTVFKKPENLSCEEFSFLEPLACCIRAVRRSKADETYNALVIGLGSIGILTVQLLKTFKTRVFGLDINPKRQEYVEFNPDIKYDLIFMTSASAEAIHTAHNLIDKGGKIIVFSSVKNDTGYLNNDIYYKELNVMGSYSPSPEDLKLSAEFLTEGKIKTGGLCNKYALCDLQKAIDDTISAKILKGYIKL